MASNVGDYNWKNVPKDVPIPKKWSDVYSETKWETIKNPNYTINNGFDSVNDIKRREKQQLLRSSSKYLIEIWDTIPRDFSNYKKMMVFINSFITTINIFSKTFQDIFIQRDRDLISLLQGYLYIITKYCDIVVKHCVTDFKCTIIGQEYNSIDVIKKYEQHLTYWTSEKDSGQTEAINKGLRMATGEIISWINSDDLYCEGAFDVVNNYFLMKPDSKIVVGNLLQIDENSQFLVRDKAYETSYDGLLSRKHFVLQQSTFFRKEVFDKVGFLDEQYNYCMDFDFWIRASKLFEFHHLDIDLAKFRFHSESKTVSKFKYLVKDMKKILRKNNVKFFSRGYLSVLFAPFYLRLTNPINKSLKLRRFLRKIKGNLY